MIDAKFKTRAQLSHTKGVTAV